MYKQVLFLLLFVSFFQSCKDEVTTLEFETITVDHNYKADIEVTLDKVVSKSDVAKRINNEINKVILETIPVSDSESITNIEEALLLFDNDYESFKTDFEETTQVWVLSVETEVLYKARNIITVGLSVYSDTGGAHGNDSIRFLNFNSQTGALLNLSDIISDIEGFKKLAKATFLDHIKGKESDVSQYFFGKDFMLPEHIGFSEEGIILLYNQYEISTFNQGYTEFVIPFETSQKFLNF